MIKRQIQRYGRWLIAIFALMAVAMVCAGYILAHQRAPNPFADTYPLRAEFLATAGLTPGLGQAVNVAGVKVGQVAGVELRDGRALVTMDIKHDKLPLVRAGTRATLVPNTPLKDLLIELAPAPSGAPLAHNAVIPIARTAAPVDSDELTSALDADTRAFFQVLAAEGARGTAGRGRDLNRLLKALGPTNRQVEQLTGALADRRRQLRRLVHNLSLVAQAVGSKDRQLADVVESANATVGALASQEAALRTSLRRLPGTLRMTGSTLTNARALARELVPTATALEPAARRLPAALAATRPLLATAEPVLRTQLRPLVRDLQPLVRDLAPATRDLSTVTPSLNTAFRTLTRVANELGYNAPGDDEGYLFWLAWFTHNSASMLSTEDAHGAFWRGLSAISCTSLTQNPGLGDVLLPIIGPLPGCGGG